MVTFLAIVASAITPAGEIGTAVHAHQKPCEHYFTVRGAMRRTNATYRGTRDVSRHERGVLARVAVCQRNADAYSFVRHYEQRARRAWYARRHPPLNTGLASWYDDAGTTGCGFHTTYGIATDVVGCGGQVTMVGPSGATVTATRDDSPGPAVAGGGRTFDLNPTTKAALGCGDLCTVRWR